MLRADAGYDCCLLAQTALPLLFLTGLADDKGIMSDVVHSMLATGIG